MLEHNVNPRISSVDGTNDREACQNFWIAILVRSNTEKRVAQKLSALGIECFLPTQKEIRQWSDRRKVIDRIVIPMVVFVRVNTEIEKKIITYSFVYKVLSYPGSSIATKIPDNQIENLKFMLGCADSSVEIYNDKLVVGDTIEIMSGPLKGLKGVLCSVESDNPMVGVYLDLLGYACVSVNKASVKSIN